MQARKLLIAIVGALVILQVCQCDELSVAAIAFERLRLARITELVILAIVAALKAALAYGALVATVKFNHIRHGLIVEPLRSGRVDNSVGWPFDHLGLARPLWQRRRRWCRRTQRTPVHLLDQAFAALAMAARLDDDPIQRPIENAVAHAALRVRRQNGRRILDARLCFRK